MVSVDSGRGGASRWGKRLFTTLGAPTAWRFCAGSSPASTESTDRAGEAGDTSGGKTEKRPESMIDCATS
eukprot:scaffold6748_cov122-Isochrysis_galbana.AAC.14